LAAVPALPLAAVEIDGFLDYRQVGVITAFGSGAAALLTARPGRRRRRRQAGLGRRRHGFRPTAVEALFQTAKARLQRLHFLLQELLPLHGPLVKKPFQ
jgi:hypothetical protein